LIGVQPATTEWGTELSPAVEAAMDSMIEAVIGELCNRVRAEVETQA